MARIARKRLVSRSEPGPPPGWALRRSRSPPGRRFAGTPPGRRLPLGVRPGRDPHPPGAPLSARAAWRSRSRRN